MLGVFKMPIKECDEVYRKLGSDVFKQNVIVGTVKMGWNHAFYDTEAWENVLKSVDMSLMEGEGLCGFVHVLEITEASFEEIYTITTYLKLTDESIIYKLHERRHVYASVN